MATNTFVKLTRERGGELRDRDRGRETEGKKNVEIDIYGERGGERERERESQVPFLCKHPSKEN